MKSSVETESFETVNRNETKKANNEMHVLVSSDVLLSGIYRALIINLFLYSFYLFLEF